MDECLFYIGRTIYALYTAELILVCPDQEEIDQIIEDPKSGKFILTTEGDLQDFLGVSIERRGDGTINLPQTQLIDHIVTDLHLDNKKVKRHSSYVVKGVEETFRI